MKVGIVHPGAMGAQLAANLDVETTWASDGRSTSSVSRAQAAGLEDVGSLSSLARVSDIIISVCPPGAAMDVARDIAEVGYRGLYVDANAVAPSTAIQIGKVVHRFVDGGIVGGPPDSPGVPDAAQTRLYVSGDESIEIVTLFEGTNVDVRVVDGGPGKASAVKMAYAGWTKGSSALLMSMAAYAHAEGVLDDLIKEWSESIPGLVRRLEGLSGRVGAKAWRFVDEMVEIATAKSDADLPEGFHQAAAEIYMRLAHLKDKSEGLTVADLLESLDRS